MSAERLANNQWFSRIILAAWVISTVTVIFLLRQIDQVVHVQLYNFGLRFDHAWADAYWTYRNLIYVCLGLPMVLSVFAIALGFTKKIDKPPETPVKQGLKPTHPIIREEPKVRESRANAITCPNCKKTFSTPLVSLNFEKGKTKLVKTCPYCNHVIGEAENEKPVNQNEHS